MHLKKLIVILMLCPTFAIVYNLTFFINENGVEIKYCVFGEKGNVIRFSLNNNTYLLKIAPPEINVSQKSKEIFEKMIEDRNMDELAYFDKKLIRYDEFLKLRKEISILKNMYYNGSFCKKITLNEKVLSFEGRTRGNYIITGNFIINEPCTESYVKENTFVCIIREGSVSLKRRLSETNKNNVIFFLALWGIAFASMWIGLKKR